MIPVAKQDLALALGLPADESNLPSRSSVANAIRKFLAARQYADLSDVAAWFEAIASEAGYDREASAVRFQSVCKLLAAAGDIALITSTNRTIVTAVETNTVNVSADYDALLGDIDAQDGLIEANSVIRHILPQGTSIDLLDHVPRPPWSALMKNLGLDEGLKPTDILRGLLDGPMIQAAPIAEGASVEVLCEWNNASVQACTITEGSISYPAIILATADGENHCVKLQNDEYLGWLYVSHAGLKCLSEWPDLVTMPDNILSILAILGTPLDDSLKQWKLGSDESEIMSGWIGIKFSDLEEENDDQSQKAVVQSRSGARLLITAGPGSGKTWTACSRIASLIDSGTVPSRILVVSFTRAAVAEIRSRISSFLAKPEEAYAIDIQTLDSLAWSLNSGERPNAVNYAGDFDDSIKAALQLIETDEDWLLDDLERFQHVVVDEAQDLSGPRRSMMLAIISRLSKNCGVSIFHDPAQSIYQFVEGSPAGIEDKLLALKPVFEKMELKHNYRCKSDKLRELFSANRLLLENSETEPADVYEKLRSNIETAADQSARRDTQVDQSETFYLFRWRSQLTSAVNRSLRAGEPVRTRLPHHRSLIEPWISASLHSVGSGLMSEQEFTERYTSLNPFPAKPANQAWQKLRRISGHKDGGIDLSQLANQIESSAPLAEIAVSDIGPRTAPLYSTIHSAKGREAETVILGLPSNTQVTEKTEILEEARVLFVGATRASKHLRLGAQTKSMRSLPGTRRRKWKSWDRHTTPAAFVEIGLQGDVEPIVHEAGSVAAEDVNYLLWKHCRNVSKAVLELKGGRYHICLEEVGEEKVVLGFMSKQFNSDLSSVGKEVANGSLRPASRVEGVFVVGSASVAIIDDERVPQFMLVPILAGTPLFFFNPTS